jgi:hypothetical protein
MTVSDDEDIEALKARIATLEAEKAAPRRLGRGITSWVLVVVAAVLFPIAVTAFWAQKTLFDTQRYVQTVAPLASDPTIQQAVTTQVSNAINDQIDASGQVDQILSNFPKLAPLAGPITAGLHNLVNTTVSKVVSSDQFAPLWTTLNQRVQQAVVRVLSSEDANGPVKLVGDQVILDTGDLIDAVKARMVANGFSWAANIPVPSVADRQIVLLTSPQLAQARLAYKIAQPISEFLIYVVLAMFVAAILVSTRRARMVTVVGIAILAGAAVLKLALTYGEYQVDSTLAGSTWAIAQDAFVSILTTYLILAIRTAFALGVVLTVVGWYLSGTGSATAARAWISRVISDAGSGAGGTALGPVGAWFARTRSLWRFLIPAVAILVLLFQSPLSGATILWVAVFTALAFVVLEFLVAAGTASTRHAVAADATGAGVEPPPSR